MSQRHMSYWNFWKFRRWVSLHTLNTSGLWKRSWRDGLRNEYFLGQLTFWFFFFRFTGPFLSAILPLLTTAPSLDQILPPYSVWPHPHCRDFPHRIKHRSLPEAPVNITLNRNRGSDVSSLSTAGAQRGDQPITWYDHSCHDVVERAGQGREKATYQESSQYNFSEKHVVAGASPFRLWQTLWPPMNCMARLLAISTI